MMRNVTKSGNVEKQSCACSQARKRSRNKCNKALMMMMMMMMMMMIMMMMMMVMMVMIFSTVNLYSDCQWQCEYTVAMTTDRNGQEKYEQLAMVHCDFGLRHHCS